MALKAVMVPRHYILVDFLLDDVLYFTATNNLIRRVDILTNVTLTQVFVSLEMEPGPFFLELSIITCTSEDVMSTLGALLEDPSKDQTEALTLSMKRPSKPINKRESPQKRHVYSLIPPFLHQSLKA